MTYAVPSRENGLRRLEEFLPLAGRDYAELRNHVPGVVSGLSPYVRHRLLDEEEITRAILQRHSYEAAEKFLQEVCWRTYWKGWLEMRPKVWLHYLEDLRTLRGRWDADSETRNRLRAAELGETGLECMDVWVKELQETGYLHNHVRMWFASIWIHTLRLPWQLGADFFMRHLLDGDPASNTLSWRWVCGLQTKGKVYLASAENIERYTGGRYAPHGLLAKEAPPMTEELTIAPPQQLPRRDTHPTGEKTLVIVSEEDLTPESWGIPRNDLAGIVVVDTAEAYPGIGKLPSTFKREALEGTVALLESYAQRPVALLGGGQTEITAGLRLHLRESGAASLSLMDLPVGPARTHIEPVLSELVREGVALRRLRRPWDESFWPHATHGFFKLKERIPSVLKRLGLP